uniref:Uncharacterized protein n=1 Tax=viral metagenome TaxID=1070528 RepID=A0A6C0J908_9ZZZZ
MNHNCRCGKTGVVLSTIYFDEINSNINEMYCEKCLFNAQQMYTTFVKYMIFFTMFIVWCSYMCSNN